MAGSHERADISASLNRLARLMGSRNVYQSQARAADLDLPQQATQVLRVLAMRVSGHDTATVSEVAEMARMDVAAVSRQLPRLTEAGLIERKTSTEKASAVAVTVTEEGRRAFERFRAAGASHVQRVLAEWSKEDEHALGDLLGRFVEDLQRNPMR